MMIRLVQARNFRCLRYINQPLQRFQVQIGPNASGKTTFQDIIRFLGTLVSSGLEDAVRLFSSGNIQEMFWNHKGDSFELAVELEIPSTGVPGYRIFRKNGWDTIRYEIEIGRDEFGGATILREFGALKKYTPPDGTLHETFMTGRVSKTERKIFSKSEDGNYTFHSELPEDGKKRWSLSLKLGEDRSALSGVPEDITKFPVSVWLKDALQVQHQRIMLDSEEMRKMAPPPMKRLQIYRLNANGSNLPWVLDTLVDQVSERYTAWIEHIQTALPDIENIFIRKREDIRHKYVVIRYAGGVEVPSWLVSDGTLRLLALTSLAYLVNVHNVILLEEPENGLHPQAIETVIQSLRSMYTSQVIVATHSPIFLNVCEPHELLCFSKREGEVFITPGDQHPMLKDWQSTPNMSALFASGVLG